MPRYPGGPPATPRRRATASPTPAGHPAIDRLAARRGKDGKRAPAAVILLSDGKRTEGSDPLEAAQRAKQLGIRISTVALGTADATILAPNGPRMLSNVGPARTLATGYVRRRRQSPRGSSGLPPASR